MAGPFFTRPPFEDRQVVQYSGRTITLSGDTNINQTGNLRIHKGAFPGLVATSLDADGTIGWGPISGISWSISACTSPLYVNNLVSCPSSGGTIQVDAGNLALNSELNFLISLSAGTNIDGVLVIDNNGYVKTVPNNMGVGNMWHIPAGYTLTVPDNYQSFIYGDMLIEGTIDLQTNAQLVVLNGNLTLSGGSIVGSGTTYLVTLNPGCCFTGGTGSCITDLYVTNIHGCSPINIQPTSPDDVYMVNGGGNVGIGVSFATTKLHISGDTIVNSDYLMLSDTLTTIPALNFKGFVNVQDSNNNIGYFGLNLNSSGETGLFIYNESVAGGGIQTFGSNHIRSAGPHVVGSDFYRNKILVSANNSSDGMVIKPKADDPSATLWFEMDAASVMILKGDGTPGGGNAFLGIALNPDGTEMPSSNFQIGGTGTTGTFKYRDGNQQNGYVLTSDTDGNANWQPLDVVLSGGCVSDICVKQLYSIRDVYIKGLTFGTGGSDIASTGTTYVTNTAVGKDVLYYNTTGVDNTGFGSEVLSANTTGTLNTGVGSESLKFNTTGGGNTAVGSGSLTVNTTGYANTAMGYNSMVSNVNGYVNTGLGVYALHDNVDGFENTAVGFYSLFNSTSGYQNTSVGNESLTNNTTGYQNTGVGYHSLVNNTIGIGNTSLGHLSGDVNDVGDFNTFLGFQATSILSNLTNATAIGYGAIVNQSDSMVLGNGLINVGIGTSTPSSTLHVEGVLGYNQFRMVTQYTPTGTADVNGNQGDVAWDDNFIYIKTSVGWKRTGLTTF